MAFAFEPSWLGQQLNLFFLPFWLAATINRWSSLRICIWKFSVENIFLGFGVVLLFLVSRVGTLSLLLDRCFPGHLSQCFPCPPHAGLGRLALCQAVPFISKKYAHSLACHPCGRFSGDIRVGSAGIGMGRLFCRSALCRFF